MSNIASSSRNSRSRHTHDMTRSSAKRRKSGNNITWLSDIGQPYRGEADNLRCEFEDAQRTAMELLANFRGVVDGFEHKS